MDAIRGGKGTLLSFILLLLALLFLCPILIVLMNAFKGKLYVSDAPFALPTAESFTGIANFIDGAAKIGFLQAFGYSLFITVGSVAVIVLFTAMTAWFITRVKTRVNTCLLYTSRCV